MYPRYPYQYRPIYRQGGYRGFYGPPPRAGGGGLGINLKQRALRASREKNPYLFKGKPVGSVREPSKTPYFIDEKGEKQPREGWRVRDGKFERDPTFHPSLAQRIFGRERLKEERRKVAFENESRLRGERLIEERQAEQKEHGQRMAESAARIAAERKVPEQKLSAAETQAAREKYVTGE
jgi:hypothetical protein